MFKGFAVFLQICPGVFFDSRSRQMKGVQLLLLLPLRLSAKGSFVEDFFLFFFCHECVNGVFKEGLNHVRSRKTELHTRSKFKNNGGKKKKTRLGSWFCTGVICLISLVLVLYTGISGYS